VKKGLKRILRVSRIDREDVEYSCVIDGTSVSTRTSVVFEEIQSAPKITSLVEREYKPRVGSEFRLRIEFTGKHNKTTLTVNGKEIDVDNENNCCEIVLRDVCDDRRVRFSVRNSCGEDSVEFGVLPVDVPGAPSRPVAVEVGDENATIHWQRPEFDGNERIGDYKVEYRGASDKTSWVVVNEEFCIEETSYNVCGLRSGSKVVFRVKAGNSVGYSEYSGVSEEVTIKKRTERQELEIIEELQDTEVTLGKTLVLKVTVRGGDGKENVTWLVISIIGFTVVCGVCVIGVVVLSGSGTG
jgi:hypothetical protein